MIFPNRYQFHSIDLLLLFINILTFLRIRFSLLLSYSNVQNSTNFQHMARMMDSLILNEFPPYTFTKITTTHRPTRSTPTGITATKLLTKSTANIPNSTIPTGLSSPGSLANGMRHNVQKAKVPTQGKLSPGHENPSDFLFFNLFALAACTSSFSSFPFNRRQKLSTKYGFIIALKKRKGQKKQRMRVAKPMPWTKENGNGGGIINHKFTQPNILIAKRFTWLSLSLSRTLSVNKTINYENLSTNFHLCEPQKGWTSQSAHNWRSSEN